MSLASYAPASNRLRTPARTEAHPTALDASARAVPTGVASVQHTDLVVSALGHHTDPAVAYGDPALGHLRTGQRAGPRRRWPHSAPRRCDRVGCDGRARRSCVDDARRVCRRRHNPGGPPLWRRRCSCPWRALCLVLGRRTRCGGRGRSVEHAGGSRGGHAGETRPAVRPVEEDRYLGSATRCGNGQGALENGLG